MRKFWSIAGYGSLLLVTLVIGTTLGYVKRSDVASQVLKQTMFGTKPDQIFGADSINVLVLGCDEDRAYRGKVLKENARSDMMLLARLDFKNRRISGVSIPRDTLIDLPGYRTMKINAAHALGGKELSAQAVANLLEVQVDRTMVLNYQAFQDIVNLLGGVEIFVPRNMKYRDKAGELNIDLKKGRQTLNGYDSMCFVRYRHGDSDFMRQERQKDFLLAFKDRLVSRPEMLAEVSNKAIALAGNEFDASEIGALALFAKNVGSENIKIGMIPVLDAPNYNLVVDRNRLRETLIEHHLIEDNLAGAYTFRQ